MTIRAEQINLTNYYNKSEVDGLIPSTTTFATHTEVSTTSGILNTKIDSISGVLNTHIVTDSGILNTYITNVSGLSKTYTDTASGALNTYISNTSGILSSRISTTSGVITTTIDNLTLDSLSGVTLTSPTSGQILGYNGSIWLNVTSAVAGATDHGALTGLDDDDHNAIYYNKTAVNGISGILNTYITNTSGQLNTRINATGAYAAIVSGQLSDRINATGLYASNVSGIFNSRINNLDLDGLSGVVCPSPTSGQLLRHDGTNWVNATVSTGSSTSLGSAYVQVSKTGNSVVASPGPTAVAWDVNDYINTTYFSHSTSTNNSRVTVLVSGYYDIGGVVLFYADATYGYWNSTHYIRKNGSNLADSYSIITHGKSDSGTNRSSLPIDYRALAASGDYFEFAAGTNGEPYVDLNSNFLIRYVGT